jgi:hypothetical protein
MPKLLRTSVYAGSLLLAACVASDAKPLPVKRGFAGGTLSCNPTTCQYDTTLCSVR